MRTVYEWTRPAPPNTGEAFRFLDAAGVKEPEPDEGLRVAWDGIAGTLVVDADADVADLLDTWEPEPSRKDALHERAMAAKTLPELRDVVAEMLEP